MHGQLSKPLNASVLRRPSLQVQLPRLVPSPLPDTRRILRHALTFYIFREPSPGVVEHTAASKVLAEIPPFGYLVDFLSSEMWPSTTRLVDAMQK